ncbi:MAG: sensor histidine kinase, partial [Candidatus Hodarchaeota archaeon]
RKKFTEFATHEFRTPLTVIKGFIELLETRNTNLSEEQIHNCHKIINTNFERLNRLLNDISDIAKLNRDDLSLEIEVIDIAQFLAEKAQTYAQLFNNQIEFRISEALSFPILAEVDRYRIHQVLDNLINNAIKHTPKTNRRITIDLNSPSREIVKISVEDNGAGIKADNLKKIFEPYVSFESKYSTKGSGIGLFLSKAIIEKMNGFLTVTSQGEDQGSTFSIELPRYIKS